MTAKTFRTWGATLLAAQAVAELEPPTSDRAASIAINEALVPVANRLGNTVAICRSSYLHPKVPAEFKQGTLPAIWQSGPRRAAARLAADERKLLTLLDSR